MTLRPLTGVYAGMQYPAGYVLVTAFRHKLLRIIGRVVRGGCQSFTRRQVAFLAPPAGASGRRPLGRPLSAALTPQAQRRSLDVHIFAQVWDGSSLWLATVHDVYDPLIT